MRERGQETAEWRGKRHWPSSFISLEERAGSVAEEEIISITAPRTANLSLPHLLQQELVCDKCDWASQEPGSHPTPCHCPCMTQEAPVQGRADRCGAAAPAASPQKLSVRVLPPKSTHLQPWDSAMSWGGSPEGTQATSAGITLGF